MLADDAALSGLADGGLRAPGLAGPPVPALVAGQLPGGARRRPRAMGLAGGCPAMDSSVVVVITVTTVQGHSAQ